MKSVYKEMLKERRIAKQFEDRQQTDTPTFDLLKQKKAELAAQRRQLIKDYKRLTKLPIEDQPIYDTNLEQRLLSLQGRDVSISRMTDTISGEIEYVSGRGYEISFEIDGELYPLFGKDKYSSIYNITDRASKDSVYDNEHTSDPVVNQIAYSLGMKYAKYYVQDCSRALFEQEEQIDREELVLTNMSIHNEK